MNRWTLVAIILTIAGSAAYYGQQYFMAEKQPAPAATKSSVIGQVRPDFRYKDIEGNIRSASEWDGKVLLVNFWATWCPPCKKEIPAFIEVQEQYKDRGFQIVGIAMDDEDSVRDYADTMGMNYPVMAAEIDAVELSRQYGNRVSALPFSAFVDRNGKIIAIKAGGMNKQAVEKIIQPLL